MARSKEALKFEKLELDLRDAKYAYLKSYGWENTSDTPGSLWLWRRDFIREDDMIVKNYNRLVQRVKDDGREFKGSRSSTHGIVLCDTETAMLITQRYLEDFKYVE